MNRLTLPPQIQGFTDTVTSTVADWFHRDADRVILGREDRLVRACVALSLLLMSAFGFLGGFRITFIALAFGVAGAYAAVTSYTGRDPIYSRFGFDSRSDDELEEAAWRAEVAEQAAGAAHPADWWGAESQWGSSLIERKS